MAESNRDEIAKLESMFAANPEGRVFTHLAEAYRKAGELAHAREVLEQGLQRHQDSASGYVVLGRVLQDSGQPEEATTAFGRVLELDPENRVALRALGELAHAGGRHEQALGYFEQLHALDPSDDGVEDLITELQGKIAAAPREPEPVAPLYPETTPSTTLPPPQFTPADFPQDLGNFDLSGFSTSGAETVPKTTPGADLDSSWMNPAAPPAPAASWGEAALPTIPAEGGDAGRAEWGESAPPSVDAAPGLPIGGEMPPVDRFPLPEAAAPELPIGGEMPPIDSFAHQDAAAPEVPEPAAVEGLERVEEPTNVAPIEGLEPADELTGALPIPEREPEPAAPFTPPPSSFDFGPVEE